MNNFGGNGAQTASHPRSSRQFNRRRHRQQTSATKTYQSHGYVFSLAARSQHQPETISILLAPRPHKLRGLLDKTSSSGASLQHEAGIPNTFQSAPRDLQKGK
jgi:hypothetical protein